MEELLIKLSKKKSPFHLQWTWDKKNEWFVLKKLKTKTEEVVEEHIVANKNDYDTWMVSLQSMELWEINKE